MKHKAVLLLFTIVASIALTCSCNKNKGSQENEKREISTEQKEKVAQPVTEDEVAAIKDVEHLRKEIASITRGYETLIIKCKKCPLAKHILINDMAKTIRKIDRHEITYYNNEIRDIERRREILSHCSIYYCDAQDTLHHRQAVVECKLDEYPGMKDTISCEMEDLIKACRKWEVFWSENEYEIDFSSWSWVNYGDFDDKADFYYIDGLHYEDFTKDGRHHYNEIFDERVKTLARKFP